MTPFGRKLRELRDRKGVNQKQMAAALGVSAAYLSALEHGKKGKPPYALLQRILHYFNLIWDEAEALEALADISRPQVRIDTAGLSDKAVMAANLLARRAPRLTDRELDQLIAILQDPSLRRL